MRHFIIYNARIKIFRLVLVHFMTKFLRRFIFEIVTRSKSIRSQRRKTRYADILGTFKIAYCLLLPCVRLFKTPFSHQKKLLYRYGLLSEFSCSVLLHFCGYPHHLKDSLGITQWRKKSQVFFRFMHGTCG